MRDGATFAEQAKSSTFDLAGDDGIVSRVQKASQITWDRKKKKFVKGDGTGADNKKIVKTESGARLPATFKSGRFDEWKVKNKKSLPRVGDAEPENASRGGPGAGDGRRFRHNKITEAKPLDPTSNTYDRKLRIIEKKKKDAAAGVEGPGGGKGGRGGRGMPGGAGGKSVGQVKNEIRTVDQIRKRRQIEERVSSFFLSSSLISHVRVEEKGERELTSTRLSFRALASFRKKRRTLDRAREGREEERVEERSSRCCYDLVWFRSHAFILERVVASPFSTTPRLIKRDLIPREVLHEKYTPTLRRCLISGHEL